MDKKIGILTGGGDCGGLNAAIEAIVKSANNEGWEVYGIRKGWEGLISGNLFRLDVSEVDGIHSQTGTVLQTSRTNPYRFTGKLDGKDLQEADELFKMTLTLVNQINDQWTIELDYLELQASPPRVLLDNISRGYCASQSFSSDTLY